MFDVIKKLSIKELIGIMILMLIFLFGFRIFYNAYTYPNTNVTELPQSFQGRSTLVFMDSTDMKNLNFKSIDRNFKPSNKNYHLFIMDDTADDKLAKFMDDNISYKFLTLYLGAPHVYIHYIGYRMAPVQIKGKEVITPKGKLYQGYTTVEDAKQGTNKKGFAVNKSADKVYVYSIGQKIKTNQGTITINSET